MWSMPTQKRSRMLRKFVSSCLSFLSTHACPSTCCWESGTSSLDLFEVVPSNCVDQAPHGRSCREGLTALRSPAFLWALMRKSALVGGARVLSGVDSGSCVEQSRQSMHRPRSRPFGYPYICQPRVAPLSWPPSFHRTDLYQATSCYVDMHNAGGLSVFRRKTQRKTRNKLGTNPQSPKPTPNPTALHPAFGPIYLVAVVLTCKLPFWLVNLEPTHHPISASPVTSSLLVNVSECASTDRLYVIRKADVAWRTKPYC